MAQNMVHFYHFYAKIPFEKYDIMEGNGNIIDSTAYMEKIAVDYEKIHPYALNNVKKMVCPRWKSRVKERFVKKID